MKTVFISGDNRIWPLPRGFLLTTAFPRPRPNRREFKKKSLEARDPRPAAESRNKRGSNVMIGNSFIWGRENI